MSDNNLLKHARKSAIGNRQSAIENVSMRLDLFLKASRLCPRRTIAQKLCDAGLVLVGNSKAKSAHAINAGDEITILRGNRLTKIRVKTVPQSRQTSSKEASSLFELLQDEFVADDNL